MEETKRNIKISFMPNLKLIPVKMEKAVDKLRTDTTNKHNGHHDFMTFHCK